MPAGRCPAGELETPELVTVVLGQDARLPCLYRGGPDEQVAQVAWARADAGEGARELALLHAQYGLHVGPTYEGRVERPPPRGPLDGTVLLRNAVQADEGEYECRVSTFPAGSFQARLRLRVLGELAGRGGTGGEGRDRRLEARGAGSAACSPLPSATQSDPLPWYHLVSCRSSHLTHVFPPVTGNLPLFLSGDRSQPVLSPAPVRSAP